MSDEVETKKLAVTVHLFREEWDELLVLIDAARKGTRK
jgi:hypothetical protein